MEKMTPTQVFLEKNKEKLINSINFEQIKAEIIENNESGLDIAANLIMENKLVAFPTETVYGLGCNALNEKAVLSIYETKSFNY